MSRTLRIATRGSALARAQTGLIAEQISLLTGIETTIQLVTTEGDISRASLSSLGGTGVFASALRDSLLAGECDVVVHSLKDLPTAAHPGLVIAAVPEREDPRDALCARDGLTLAELPEGARVGTGSPRRRAQLLSVRPDLDVVDVRGNIDTRLRSVEHGDLHAVVLAAAGLNRLGRLRDASELFELHSWPTAPGQGALAIEAREGDTISELLKVEHSATRLSVVAERAILAALEAGCAAPIGALATVVDGILDLHGVVYAPDGSAELGCERSVTLTGVDDQQVAYELGAAMADQLLEDGARELAPLGNA